MKVVRVRCHSGGFTQRLGGSDVNGGLSTFGDLETAVAEEEGLADDGEAEVFEGLAGDEEVGDAVFVFQ